ncbi:hypothetical protein MHYP_G00031190 [Metynnis hypsauchen]
MRFDMLDYGEKLKDPMDIPAQLDLSDFPGVASLGKQSGGAGEKSLLFWKWDQRAETAAISKNTMEDRS